MAAQMAALTHACTRVTQGRYLSEQELDVALKLLDKVCVVCVVCVVCCVVVVGVVCVFVCVCACVCVAWWSYLWLRSFVVSGRIIS